MSLSPDIFLSYQRGIGPLEKLIKQIYGVDGRQPRNQENAATKVGFIGEDLMDLGGLFYQEDLRSDKIKEQPTELYELREAIKNYQEGKGPLSSVVLELADMYYVLYASAVMNNQLGDPKVRLRIKTVLQVDGLPDDLDIIRSKLGEGWEELIQLVAYVKISLMGNPDNPRNTQRERIKVLKKKVDEGDKKARDELDQILQERDQWEMREIVEQLKQLSENLPQELKEAVNTIFINQYNF